MSFIWTATVRLVSRRVLSLGKGLKRFKTVGFHLHHSAIIHIRPLQVDRVSQCSFFSSTPEDIWVKSIDRLLDSRIGIWSGHDWQQAIQGVIYWQKQETTESIALAWKLIDRAIEEEEKTTHVDHTSINIPLDELLEGIVNAWSQTPGQWTSRDILNKIETYKSRLPKLNVTNNTYDRIMDNAIKHGEENAHVLASQVLQKMISGGLGGSTVRPTVMTFTIAIDALAKSGASDAPQQAEALFRKINDLACRGWDNMTPSTITYSALISTWANSGQQGAAKRAEQLLMECPSPATSCFNAVMNAWSKSTAMESADRCYQIFQHMKTSTNGIPNAISYGTVINAFAKRGRAREAEAIMFELLNEYEQQTNNIDLMPDRIQFNSLLHAWAKSGEKGAALRAEALLEKMYTIARETKNNNLLPDVVSFSSILDAWAKSNDPMAASRAEAILQIMHEHDKSGAFDMKPNLVTYCAVLDCLAKSRSTLSANRSREILEQMIARYEAGESNVKPDIVAFSIVISAFAKVGDQNSAVKAQEIFDRMTLFGVHPNTKTFSSLLSALIYCRDPRAAEIGEGYFAEMKRRYASGDTFCKPDTIFFSTLIKALCISEDPTASDRAVALLGEMKQWQAAGHKNCSPSIITYNSLMDIISRSKSTDKAVVAWNILREMDECSIKPDDGIFRFVLKACGYSNKYDLPNREQAFKIAMHTLTRALKETKPSADMFSFFFMAAAGLGHDKEVELVYNISCKGGFDRNKDVRHQWRRATKPLVQK